MNTFKAFDGVTFGEAIEAVKQGKLITRSSWRGEFVFMQVPSVISKDIVPKMQSLPQAAKDEFQKRFDDPSEQVDAIYYNNQLAIVSKSNLISGYSPSPTDALANDWLILP